MNSALGNIENDLTSAHAAVIPMLSGIYSCVDYVKGVATVVGSDYIHGVYENANTVKIYFKNKECVDSVVSSGIRVKGHFVNVDYAVPPGTKVILTNVDPSVPDNEISKHLTLYCSMKSPIIKEIVFKDLEYSHIKCGRRKVYVEVFQGSKLPSELNFMHRGIYHQIHMIVEETAEKESCISTDNKSTHHNDDVLCNTCMKQENLESDSSVEMITDQDLRNVNCSITFSKIQHKTYRTQNSITRRAAANIKKVYKQIGRGGSRGRRGRGGRRGRPRGRGRQNYLSHDEVTAISSERDQKLHDSENSSVSAVNHSLNDEPINLFLDAVKCQRNVKELAEETITQGHFTSLSHLISELNKHAVSCDQNMGHRINRVVEKLSETGA